MKTFIAAAMLVAVYLGWASNELRRPTQEVTVVHEVQALYAEAIRLNEEFLAWAEVCPFVEGRYDSRIAWHVNQRAVMATQHAKDLEDMLTLRQLEDLNHAETLSELRMDALEKECGENSSEARAEAWRAVFRLLPQGQAL